MRYAIQLLVVMAVSTMATFGQSARSFGAEFVEINLGFVLPEHNRSHAISINDRGQVIGFSYVYPNGPLVQWIWDGIHGTQPIRELESTSARVIAINNSGAIVGRHGDDGSFLLDPVHGLQFLTPLPGALPSSTDVYDINDMGQMVGVCSVGGRKTATVWDSVHSPRALIPLGLHPIWHETRAYSINNAGYVVGEAESHSEGHWVAVVWGPQGAIEQAIVQLDDPYPAYGGNLYAARAISDSGLIVGSRGEASYLWNGDEVILVTNPFGASNSYAVAVNDLRQVVGWDNSGAGFVWDDGQLRWWIDYGFNDNNEIGQVVGYRWDGGDIVDAVLMDRFGNYDHDGDLDLVDYAGLQLCFSGPCAPGCEPTISPACQTMDFDTDGDVDMSDFEQIAEQISGPRY